MVRHSGARWVLALGVVGTLLVGCSSVGADDDGPMSLDQFAAEARARGYDWQAGLLEDGDVTVAEFDEGHRRNLECLTAAGLVYSDLERDLLDGFRWDYLIGWNGVDEETANEAVSACAQEFLGYIEPAMSAWGDWSTEPAALAGIKECVTAKGFEIDTAAQNYREVYLSAADQGLTYEPLETCIASTMQRLHPGVGYAVGY
ncbi:MAG TPA: hypothetical protein VGC57_03990 [Cellulomonas sp.]